MSDKNPRVLYIDFFKGIMICFMVMSHTLYFFPLKSPTSLAAGIVYYHTTLGHIATFSGLFFSFGFVCSKAYIFSSKPGVYRRLAKTVLRMFTAFYFSGILYFVLVRTSDFNLNFIYHLLLFNVVPGYSEFLAAYFLAGLLLLIFLKPLRRVIENKYLLVLFILLSLLSTFLPVNNISNAQLAYVMGSGQFTTFPVLQFAALWFAGAALGHYEVRNKYILGAGIIGLVFSYIGWQVYGNPIQYRFPPNILYIVGAVFPVSVLLIVSKYVTAKAGSNFIIRFFIWVGKDTMFFFLFSNVYLFSFSRVGILDTSSYLLTMGLSILFILGICLLKFIVVKEKGT